MNFRNSMLKSINFNVPFFRSFNKRRIYCDREQKLLIAGGGNGQKEMMKMLYIWIAIAVTWVYKFTQTY